MQIGQRYKIQIDVVDLDNVSGKPKKKHVSATLLKEFPDFYLFQTKHYKTTIHKQDYRRNRNLIWEGIRC